VARLSTARQRSRLRDHDGAVLAELVLDRVTAQTLIGEPPMTLRWSEIEIELGERGGPQLLKAADRQLRRNGLRRSRHSSKLEAVLGDRLPDPAVGPEPKSSASAGETVLYYLRAQIEELLACDPAVRRDIPDSVHRMRVASRRLRSTLQSFRPLLRREQTEPLIGELRWLGEVLGRSRDDEVLREHLAAGLGEVPVELVLGPVSARLAAHFAPRQAEGREALLESLGSGRYLALLDGLDRLASGAMLAPEADRHAATALPPLVWRTFRRTRRRMDKAYAASDAGRRELALHEARKAAKRARYAAETAAPVVGKKARRSAKSLKKIQSALGEHQDTVIARQAIRQLGIRANAAGENAFTYGLLHARQAELAQVARDRAGKAWKRASSKKNIAWMH
jgi:CHAD domain-containing protein